MSEHLDFRWVRRSYDVDELQVWCHDRRAWCATLLTEHGVLCSCCLADLSVRISPTGIGRGVVIPSPSK